MTVVKTSELTGAALDWAVATAKGYSKIALTISGEACEFLKMHSEGYHNYSTDWSQGGPIIEREGIGFRRNGKMTFSNEQMRYEANVIRNQDDAPICRIGFRGTGPTPLIAAMRCYVASKLGDTVEIPEELL